MNPEAVTASVVVDVANVMGSRPDGWWRDRAGAAARLCREISALAERGVPEAGRPEILPPAGPVAFVLVLEGRARTAADSLGNLFPGIRVVLAEKSGDDTIVGEVRFLRTNGERCLVVTADRELRRRCEQAGAGIAPPGWLLRLL